MVILKNLIENLFSLKSENSKLIISFTTKFTIQVFEKVLKELNFTAAR